MTTKSQETIQNIRKKVNVLGGKEMKSKLFAIMMAILILVLGMTFTMAGCKTDTEEAATEETVAEEAATEEVATEEAATEEAASEETATPESGYKIAMVVQAEGIYFFEVFQRGWEEALAELGDESIFRGPEGFTPEGQIEIMEQLITQEVDGICYVANDPFSLANTAKRAMDQGIAVVGWESGIVPDSRNLSIEPVTAEQIGRGQVQMIAELIDYEGEIAILSAIATAENQNGWIKWMDEELKLPEYENMELVAKVYPQQEDFDNEYNEALGLIKSYPDLKGIISPTAVGLPAACQAITEQGLIDKIELTGIALPSDMADWVHSGACKEFGIWNVIDLGYLNAYATHLIAAGEITGAPGEEFDAGRLGHYKIIAQEGVSNGVAYLRQDLMKFDIDNIDEYKDKL